MVTEQCLNYNGQTCKFGSVWLIFKTNISDRISIWVNVYIGKISVWVIVNWYWKLEFGLN